MDEGDRRGDHPPAADHDREPEGGPPHHRDREPEGGPPRRRDRRAPAGGRGPQRTPRLAARYADEFNLPFRNVSETAEAFERVVEAQERIGRGRDGRAPLVLSAGVVVAIGRDDAQARRRAAPLHVPSALPPEDPVIGSPARLVDRIGEFAAIGATRVHLRLIDFNDLDHLELIAAEVLPQLGPA
ncbi:hypothetical protein [Nonomuraea jabiensis]|uniref:hypothetical protein n=1 Tax=Nonomuraea jabiensis TaxID=882448 RepID=UPI0036913E6C